MQFVIAILAFCVIIIIHELGHFIAAKLCGVQVNEFSLGMGPVLLRKQGKETMYSLRAIPIGGFVSMEGENDASDNPRAFNRKPVWQRMIVILAGAIMNLVLGYFVSVGYVCAMDDVATTTISTFRENSVSSQQLMLNDRIASIDGLPIFTSTDIIYKLQSGGTVTDNGDVEFDFVVERNGESVELENVQFELLRSENGINSIYFDFTVYPMDKNVGSVLSEGFRESLSTGRLVMLTLWDLVTGKYGLNDLSGPVGVVDVVSQTVEKGFFEGLADFLYIVSLITINLGIFNLLPIPALDGGRFLFLVIEAIRRKPMKPEHEGIVHFVGFALLMILVVIVTFNDIVRIFSGG